MLQEIEIIETGLQKELLDLDCNEIVVFPTPDVCTKPDDEASTPEHISDSPSNCNQDQHTQKNMVIISILVHSNFHIRIYHYWSVTSKSWKGQQIQNKFLRQDNTLQALQISNKVWR